MTLPHPPPALLSNVRPVISPYYEKRHRILREVLRNFLTFESLCTQAGVYEVEHAGLTLSFLDLQGLLERLSPRKMQAVWMNVVLDMKQKDVARIMGIRTVTVGQYVDQGMIQICDLYFAEMEPVQLEGAV